MNLSSSLSLSYVCARGRSGGENRLGSDAIRFVPSLCEKNKTNSNKSKQKNPLATLSEALKVVFNVQKLLLLPLS